MSRPYHPNSYATLFDRALEHEEKSEWIKAAQVWKSAIKVARTQSEWFRANSERDYCLRRLAQSTTQQEAV